MSLDAFAGLSHFQSLDSFCKEQLLEDMIRQLSDYAGDVIMVSHSRDEIYQFCDRLLILDQGRVIVTGDTKDIFDQPGYREGSPADRLQKYY